MPLAPVLTRVILWLKYFLTPKVPFLPKDIAISHFAQANYVSNTRFNIESTPNTLQLQSTSLNTTYLLMKG